MIELRDLRFAFAVDGFTLQVDDLSIAQGTRCCWVGPSGSGKTTLLHLVAGILVPEKGQIISCEQEIGPLSDAERRDFRIANIGLVFQDFALLDYLTLFENILLPYRISRILQIDREVRLRAEQYAVVLGLRDLLSRKPAQLSQGERQRVAVCRALIARPKLILADEPTANLDPDNANRVMEALELYSDEHQATLVTVSHDREVVARFDTTSDVSQFCGLSEKSSREVGGDA